MIFDGKMHCSAAGSFLGALTLSLLATAGSWAAEGEEQKVLVRTSELLDVRSGEVLRDRDVLIVNGRIAAVSSGLSAVEGSEVVDLRGLFVLPGLMDAHVHLTSDATAHGYRGLAISTPRATLIGAKNAKITLEAGFTTVRNVGAGGYSDVALRDAIADGDVPGPRLLVSGPALGITGGHCDNNLLPADRDFEPHPGIADGPWEVRRAVRRNVKYGVDLIKFCATGGVLSKGTKIGAQQFTFEEMRALVDEAHTLGIKVTAHAHGTQGIKTALRAGVDSIEHASLIDAEGIALAKERGARLVMDVYVTDFILSQGEAVGILPESLEKERQVGSAQRESFSQAVAEGVSLTFGTDAGVFPHGQNAKQFEIMVRYGMTPLQTIRAATLGNAELFGIEDLVGTLEVGKSADMIAVSSSPLEDVSRLQDVRVVIKEGQVFKNVQSASGADSDGE